MLENNEKINVLLFDVSPFYYIGYYGATYCLKNTNQDLSDEKKVYEFTRNLIFSKIKKCIEKFQDKNALNMLVFCYDGYCARKKELAEDYKAGRTSNVPSNIRKMLEEDVKKFPGFHLFNKEEEADDILATAKRCLKESFKNITFWIFSKDNDLLQLCDYRTFLIDPTKETSKRDRFYLFEKFNGLNNFKHIILHKICFGDSSDNIEGIFKGKKRKPIIEKIKEFSSFSGFLDSDLIKDSNKKQQAIKLYSMIRLRENLELVVFQNKNSEGYNIMNFFEKNFVFHPKF